MKLLLIEDDPDIAEPLKKSLERRGYAVDWKDDGEAGLRYLKIYDYDCCLLDLNLPNIDGMEVLKQARESGKSTPVIMLTARSQIYDKLEGFDIGADDYITKPFHLREVFARIEAVIRRSSKNSDIVLSLGPWQLDEDRLICRDGDQEVELSNKEMGVLVYLVRNQGRVVSAEELLEHVWNSDVDMFSDTVKTHIKTLRKKIDPDKVLIKTVKGKGYSV